MRERRPAHLLIKYQGDDTAMSGEGEDGSSGSLAAEERLTASAEALSAQFSKALSSLTKEATTLQQISSLIAVLESERANGDGGCTGSTSSPAPTQQQLIELDEVVSSLEGRTEALEELASGEEQATREIWAVLEAADRQRQVLEAMLDRLPTHLEQPQEKENRNGFDGGGSPKASKLAEDDEPATSRPQTDRLPRTDEMVQQRRKSSAAPTGEERIREQAPEAPTIAHHPQQERPPSSVRLDRITEKELLSVPRTVRGHRINRAALNDALADIEAVGRQKAAAAAREAKRKQQISTWKHHGTAIGAAAVDTSTGSSNSWCSSNNNSNTKEDSAAQHDHHKQRRGISVSEQELRQSCAFFRFGESTARTVLLTLRALGRLTQVPSKNGDMVYVLVEASGER